MPTALGYSSAGIISQPVKNTGATLIPQGAICSLKVGATATLISSDQTIVEVELAGTPTKFCGVAATAMPSGGGGTVIQIGPCLVMTTAAALLIGVAVKVASSDYKIVAQGGSGTIVGVSLRANHTADTAPDYGANTTKYAECWMNFITSASFGYT